MSTGGPIRGRVIARDGDDALVRTARGDVRVKHAGTVVAGDLVEAASGGQMFGNVGAHGVDDGQGIGGEGVAP